MGPAFAEVGNVVGFDGTSGAAGIESALCQIFAHQTRGVLTLPLRLD
jgi:hypothetical protein